MGSSNGGPVRPVEPVAGALERVGWVLGSECLDGLGRTRVILFGVGGVGSWCAEALVRSGVGHVTLVDPDVVTASNLNRQLQATPSSLGRPKVEALAERLRAVWPGADVRTVQRAYALATRDSFSLATFDYVIDAIDSLSNKVGLIQHAQDLGCTVFSSMGAARRLDPSQVRACSLWDTEGDPLARFVRKRLRRRGFEGDLLCVTSDETASPVTPDASAPDASAPDASPPDASVPDASALDASALDASALDASALDASIPDASVPDASAPDASVPEASVPEASAPDASVPDAPILRPTPTFGSLMPVTATFGMVLASLVIQDVARRFAAEA